VAAVALKVERVQKNPAANGAFGYGDRLVQVRYLGVRDRLDEGAQAVGARRQSGPRISRGPGQTGASLLTVTERAPSLAPASSAGSWGLPVHAEIGTDNLHPEHPDIGIVQPSGSCFEHGRSSVHEPGLFVAGRG
jgi:hypothetical protein